MSTVSTVKLKLLDAIEKIREVLQETLAKMDSRIISLESARVMMNRDINEIKDSLSFTQDQHTKSNASFESLRDQTNL